MRIALPASAQVQAKTAHDVSYPSERIPKHAVLTAAAFAGHSRCDVPCVLDAGEAAYVSRGNVAIALALIHAGIGRGDEVLLPAYHCISMVEPIIWRGANPVFYRICSDTSPDVGDIARRLTSRTRALLVAHYFGFPQPLEELRAYCDAHGLVLIEDCAHAFFGSRAGHPIGWFGDYAIASAWKFFPVCEGGCLVSSKRSLANLRLETPGVLFQLKTALNTVEYAFAYDRMRPLKALVTPVMRAAAAAWRRVKTQDTAGASADTTSNDFAPRAVTREVSSAAKFIIDSVSRSRIVNKRRTHYLQLLDACRDLPGCAPLFPELPGAVVPQVFPLLVDEPEQIFDVLKSQGVPIIRFGEFLWPAMPRSLCPVSTDLSRRVFQFPCHQELAQEELEWMIECIREAMLARRSRNSTEREDAHLSTDSRAT